MLRLVLGVYWPGPGTYNDLLNWASSNLFPVFEIIAAPGDLTLENDMRPFWLTNAFRGS